MPSGTHERNEKNGLRPTWGRGRGWGRWTGISRRTVSALLTALALSVGTAQAAEPAGPDAAGTTAPPATNAVGLGPQKVRVGVFLMQAPEFDLKNNTYALDFWIWFAWKGPINPVNSFEFVNAVSLADVYKVPSFVDDAGNDAPVTLPDGSLYQCYRVQAQFCTEFRVEAYPFDQHDLLIRIEEFRNYSDAIEYEADPRSNGVDPAFAIPGWRVSSLDMEATNTSYTTDFGDTRTAGDTSTYARLNIRVHMVRPVSSLMAKTVVPLAIVMLITFCAFLAAPELIDARLTLTITGLFAAVALQFTSSDELPPVGYMTLMDKIYILSYGAILLATMLAIISSRHVAKERLDRAAKLDRWAIMALLTLFFGGILILVRTR